MLRAHTLLCLSLLSLVCSAPVAAQGRKATNDDELRSWLSNMVQHHYAPAEMGVALDLSEEEVRAALQRLEIDPTKPNPRTA